MSTIEKLNAYGAALTKWKSQKRRNDLLAADGKKTKPLDPMPLPMAFELPFNDPYAVRVRESILKPEPVINIPQRRNQIKVPARKL